MTAKTVRCFGLGKSTPESVRQSIRNGAHVTSYTAQCVSNNGSVTKKGTGTTITVSGLTVGQKYVCGVRATNSRGTGPTSLRSAQMTA